MAACKRVIRLGTNCRSAYKATISSVLSGHELQCNRTLSSNLFANRFVARKISQLVKPNGNRVFLVDTLKLVRSLEAQGTPTNQAESIVSAITEVLNDSLENLSYSFPTRSEMQKAVALQEANLSKIESKVKSIQEYHISLLQRETEKLHNDVEKLRNELRYEIDKVNAGHRLDLNLERGRMRDLLAHQSTETSNLTNKLDQEISTLKVQLEAAKYDVIKYCIGFLVSISAASITVLRIFNSEKK